MVDKKLNKMPSIIKMKAIENEKENTTNKYLYNNNNIPKGVLPR